MANDAWGDIIISSFQTLWVGFIGYLPNLIGALIIFIIGWGIAVALGKFVARIITAIHVDKVLERLGLKKIFDRAGFKLDAGLILGELVKWFLIIVFLMAAVDILGLTQVTIFLRDVIAYIPNLIAAVLMLIVGVLLANFLQRLVKGAVKAAEFEFSQFLAGITKWAVLIFAFVAALIQLGIAPSLINTLVTGLVAMIAIAGGLAFGLGGKDLASEILKKLRSDITGK